MIWREGLFFFLIDLDLYFFKASDNFVAYVKWIIGVYAVSVGQVSNFKSQQRGHRFQWTLETEPTISTTREDFSKTAMELSWQGSVGKPGCLGKVKTSVSITVKLEPFMMSNDQQHTLSN